MTRTEQSARLSSGVFFKTVGGTEDERVTVSSRTIPLQVLMFTYVTLPNHILTKALVTSSTRYRSVCFPCACGENGLALNTFPLAEETMDGRQCCEYQDGNDFFSLLPCHDGIIGTLDLSSPARVPGEWAVCSGKGKEKRSPALYKKESRRSVHHQQNSTPSPLEQSNSPNLQTCSSASLLFSLLLPSSQSSQLKALPSVTLANSNAATSLRK